MPQTFRSPRSIALEKNDADLFAGEGGYDAASGVPSGDASKQGKEQDYAANPVNQPEPTKEWAAK